MLCSLLSGVTALALIAAAPARNGANLSAPPGGNPRVLSGVEIARMVEAFLAAPQAAARQPIAKALSEGGPDAATALLGAMDTWLERNVGSGQQTGRRASGRDREPDPRKEIAKLQTSVQSLRGEEPLAKEQIVRVADPAMLRLSSLLKGLARAEKESLRGVALEFGQYRAACKKALGESLESAADDATRRDADMTALYRRMKADAVLRWNREKGRELPRDERDGIEDLNRIRMTAGLKPVKIDVLLCLAAREHSSDMERLNFFDHTSPVKGKTTPFDRARRAGTEARSENIFTGSSSPQEANQSWFHSPGHFKNLTDPGAEYAGLGRSGTHWTQMFR